MTLPNYSWAGQAAGHLLGRADGNLISPLSRGVLDVRELVEVERRGDGALGLTGPTMLSACIQ